MRVCADFNAGSTANVLTSNTSPCQRTLEFDLRKKIGELANFLHLLMNKYLLYFKMLTKPVFGNVTSLVFYA